MDNPHSSATPLSSLVPCIINMNTTTIWLFGSITNKSLWMDNVKVNGVTDIYACYSPNPLQNALNLITCL